MLLLVKKKRVCKSLINTKQGWLIKKKQTNVPYIKEFEIPSF